MSDGWFHDVPFWEGSGRLRSLVGGQAPGLERKRSHHGC